MRLQPQTTRGTTIVDTVEASTPAKNVIPRSRFTLGTPASGWDASTSWFIAAQIFASFALASRLLPRICGGQLAPARDADTAPIEVPMAFQSAMAGIMLAAEIVATGVSARRKAVMGKTVIDLLRPAPKRLNVPVLKRTDGVARCICADPDYQKVYSRKYAEQLT